MNQYGREDKLKAIQERVNDKPVCGILPVCTLSDDVRARCAEQDDDNTYDGEAQNIVGQKHKTATRYVR